MKQKEQTVKLEAYRKGLQKILSTRKPDSYDKQSFAISAQLLSVNPDIYTLWNYRKEVALMEIAERYLDLFLQLQIYKIYNHNS